MSFIVLEGLDGAGKSTQIKFLLNYLESQDIHHKFMHFPRTDAPVFGDLVARFLRGELGDINAVNPYLIALIYAGDRYDASQIINQWLEQGLLVIADRYVLSNIAFQCAKLHEESEVDRLSDWIRELEYGYYKIPEPDLNLLLDVPFSFVSNNLKRERKGDDRDYLNGKSDIHEDNLTFQSKVRDVYLREFSRSDRDRVIDCSEGQDMDIMSPEEIFDRVLTTLKDNRIL